MPIAPTNKIVVAEFNEYLGKLANSMTGMAFSKVVKGEAASILSKAAQETKAASVTKIRSKYKIRSRQRKDLPAEYQEKGARGRYKKSVPKGAVKGSRTEQSPDLVEGIKMDGKFYNTSYYYPEPVWQRLKNKLKFFEDQALARRYSGAATWFLIAMKAKLPTSRFKKKSVMWKAIQSQGGSYGHDSTENGQQKKKRFTFYVEVFNGANCCLNKSARGVFAIRSAMAGRIKSYETHVRKKTFDNAKEEVRNYPNIYLAD
jgi:hypothetical protein